MQSLRRAARAFLTLSASFSATLGSVSTSAQQASPADDLARCAEIATDTVRLACFDALARELEERTDTNRTTPEPNEELPAAGIPQDINEDAFGAELIGGREALGPDEIQSRLIGEFTGWRGNTTFTLENGQTWRQAEGGRLVFRADAPLITIRRGAFGSYRLTVEGVNRAVRVRRVE
ncbi:MAG: hypothetical protein GWN29_04770 [Gammaproteobacteria bacterium]|nr:hypothetical protein [Gammaproteobacteria bacterium]